MEPEGWHHLDLFCGPGGFATGFKAAGFHTVLGLDIHEPSVRTFARNHPATSTIHADIRDVSWDDIERRIGGRPIHVISAGVPCEGFSKSNRNRNRFLDERNFLFLEFLRIVEAARPPYIVLENVPALTSHSNGFFKTEIEHGMHALGYVVKSRVLDALEFGVPQRRRRIFFVGSLPGWRFEWPEPTHGPGRLPPVTVWEAIGDLPALQAGEVANEYGSPPHSEYASRMRGDCQLLRNHEAPRHHPATVRRIAETEPGEPMYPRFKQRIRLHPDRPAPTIVSGGIRPQFHYGHPTQARGLTVREQARLQSFPDSYYFEGGMVQGRVQTGDAVPPILAWRIAEQIAFGLAVNLDVTALAPNLEPKRFIPNKRKK